jgi:hypothetical protein
MLALLTARPCSRTSLMRRGRPSPSSLHALSIPTDDAGTGIGGGGVLEPGNLTLFPNMYTPFAAAGSRVLTVHQPLVQCTYKPIRYFLAHDSTIQIEFSFFSATFTVVPNGDNDKIFTISACQWLEKLQKLLKSISSSIKYINISLLTI